MSLVCGIELSASEAILVTIEGTKSNFKIINNDFKRISLGDKMSQSDVLSFKQTIQNYFENEGIKKVGIKARATKGDFAGGPMSFKLEGILQTLDIPVELIHSSTIAAAIRKHGVDITNQQINKYQYEAFKVAYYLLGD